MLAKLIEAAQEELAARGLLDPERASPRHPPKSKG